MKKRIKKTEIMIIIVFFVCGVFINVLLATLSYQLSYSYSNSLESFTTMKLIASNETPVEKDKFIQFLFLHNDDKVVLRSSENDIIYIFDPKHNFDLINIVSGSYFSEQQFTDFEETALLSINRSNEIYKIDNLQYFDVDGIPYKVVGLFDNDDFKGSIFVNLASVIMRDRGLPIEGEYKVSDQNSGESLSSWREFANENNAYLETMKEDFFEAIMQIANEYSFIIIIFLLSVVSIMLNTINGIYYWLLSRKEELGIRLLVGSTKQRVKRFVFKEFTIKILASYFVSVVVSWIAFFLINVENLNLSILNVIIAWIFLFALGAFILSLALRNFMKNDISLQIGGE